VEITKNLPAAISSYRQYYHKKNRQFTVYFMKNMQLQQYLHGMG
jgi:hypothetical protein